LLYYSTGGALFPDIIASMFCAYTLLDITEKQIITP